MKAALLLFLVINLAFQSHPYQYDKPQVGFRQDTKIIKGNNGQDYEITMSPSRQLYEANLAPKEEILIVQHVNQPVLATTSSQEQQSYMYPSPVVNSQSNPDFVVNHQQSLSNQQQFTNQYRSIPVENCIQNHCNQLAPNSNYQYQRPQYQQQQQQDGILTQGQQQQQQQQQQQPQKYYPQQYDYYLQQTLPNNNLPNSNNLLNDLLNNHKYVSQSEASQLDVYPYKQTNANPRPYTRIITKCNVSGQCEQQNAAAGSGIDFIHQQVLKQSKAQIEPNAYKCQNKHNYLFTGNGLTSNTAKTQKRISVKKGSDMKNRRLFPYCEVVLPQYAQN